MTPYYQDEAVAIYHGDCREIVPTLGRFDLLLTDPPYSSGARTDSNRQCRGSMLRGIEDDDWFSHDAMTTWGFKWFMGSVLMQLRERLNDGSHVYWFTDWRMTPTVYGMLEAYGFRVNHCLVWAKTHFGMGSYWRNQHENIVFASCGQPTPMQDKGRGSVLTSKNVAPSERDHPTEKPVDLIMQIISATSGKIILDPFAGSGTTGRAAKDLGRKAVLIEREERYCEIAARRMSQSVLSFTPPPPTKVGTIARCESPSPMPPFPQQPTLPLTVETCET